ncbi:HFL161Cp [Eremothecium sinecaudum]|uniref:Sensitive to high expression protein 9, mitochondrial n=1 Tax=Eremothecium sinecaudum TaxID=45286 RepID=A0A0X8HUL0_9SACH|nr:HFL161Cp [Eremothecium sinecaudum]AMD21695.1 HFL161Cp [Eremothecium sinecaudum]
MILNRQVLLPSPIVHVNRLSALTLCAAGNHIRVYSTSRTSIKPWTELQKKLEACYRASVPKWKETLHQVSYYSTQIKYHLDKAKQSLRETNQKLLEQEKQQQNTNLSFNEDLENKSKIVGLPSERERKRYLWSRKLEFYLDSLQETIFTATKALNDVTGYSSIDKLRKSIEMMESQLNEVKSDLERLRDVHHNAVAVRNQSQIQVNELLQRKHMWTPEELDRFTKLYIVDAENAKKEEAANAELKAVEAKEKELSNLLHRAILTRYHEEQIWSDKIRRTSTWGTFILMGINILLFLVFQLLLEPWKRRRLTRSFEEKVKVALEQTTMAQNGFQFKEAAVQSSVLPASEQSISPEPIPPLIENRDEITHSSTALQPISLSSFSDFKHSTYTNLQNIQIWLGSLLHKLYSMNYLAYQDQTNLSIGQFHVYSGVIFIFGILLGSLVS